MTNVVEQFSVKENNFFNGKVMFTGTKEECEKYKHNQDNGYAGDRPSFSIQPV